MKYRIHLRHTGGDKPHFGMNSMWNGWRAGFNIDLGYWFIAVRRKTKGEVHRPLVEFGFGKAQQRDLRMRKSEAFKRGRQEGAKGVFESWISEEGHYWLIEDLLKKYDLVYENDRVREVRRPDVNANV